MLDYNALLRCMQQLRIALRAGDRAAVAAQLDQLDLLVGPQRLLDIYGRLLVEETEPRPPGPRLARSPVIQRC